MRGGPEVPVMRPARWLVRLCLVALGVGLLATPAAAQSVNRAVIDDLNEQLLYVALPLTLFVEVTLVYAVYRFRDNDDPRPTVDDPALEITWTAATGVILVFVGVSAFFVLSNPYLTPAAAGAADPAGGDATGDLEVEVLAYQWGWEFHYPDANVTARSRLVLPVDTDVRFVLASADVIHSLYVPELGIKQDVFPGHESVARTRATDTGEYRLYCAELCGSGHARMHATVDVRNGSAYRAWLERRGAGAGA
jgi:cytochrome c oxidase subunit 2